jgi:hypothetical protein
MRNLISMLVLVVAAACAPKGAQTAAVTVVERAAAPVVASSPRAPMTVEWIYQGESGGRLTLVARVNRNAPIRIPATVTVSVPAGVRVVSGRTSWVIEGSESTSPVEETLVFEVVQAAPQEIVLAADAETVNFGVHAKKAYKLGQAPQKGSVPATTGPALEVGGHVFGPSVPAKP